MRADKVPGSTCTTLACIRSYVLLPTRHLLNNMFSLFPDLLALYPFAGFVLRIIAGYVFILHGVRLLRYAKMAQTRVRAVLSRLLGSGQLAIGLLLMAGLWVQGAALAGAVLAFLDLESTFSHTSSSLEREVYLLLGVICLALLVLGAGPFAIDLPL